MNVIIESMVVLLGGGGKALDVVTELQQRAAVGLSAIDGVAHAHGDRLHRLPQVFLVLLDVRHLSVDL